MCYFFRSFNDLLRRRLRVISRRGSFLSTEIMIAARKVTASVSRHFVITNPQKRKNERKKKERNSIMQIVVKFSNYFR